MNKLINTLLGLVFLFFTLSVHAQIPTDGLISVYNLDFNAEDSVSNNDGMFIGNFMGAENRYGQEDKALLFGGESDYINVPDDSSLDITQGITISVWLKPKSIPNLGFFALVNKWEFVTELGAGGGYYLGINASDNSIRWNTGSISADGSPIPINEWTHLVVTYDRDSMNIYQNCILDLTVPGLDSIQATTVPFRMGQQSEIFSVVPSYDGFMDEVLIYDRALQFHEIEQICNIGPTSVADINNFSVEVFPNPFTRSIQLKMENSKLQKGEIVDAQGRLVKNLNNLNIHDEILLDELQNGFYFIKILTTEGQYICKKIIKM